MARRQRERETLILSITRAAEKLEMDPRHLRYLIQKHHLQPVPQLKNPDKRCKFFVYTDLLSVVAR